jgi:hypothetical protein
MRAMMHVTRRAIPRAMTPATRHAIRPATLHVTLPAIPPASAEEGIDETAVPDLSWVDGFINRINLISTFAKRTCLIRMPNQAFKLNRAAAGLLLTKGRPIADVLKEGRESANGRSCLFSSPISRPCWGGLYASIIDPRR